MTEPAAEASADLATGSTGSSALIDPTFSPEAHSWILVPEAAEAMPGLLGFAAVHEGAAATAAAAERLPTPPPMAASVPASPTMMRETGDIVATLAVSEILSAESQWPLPLSLTSPLQPQPLTCSDASYDEPSPPSHPVSADSARAEARKLGALAFPPIAADAAPAKGSCAADAPPAAAEEESDSESDTDLLDDILEPLVPCLQAWVRPLALVAVLVASHAACLLIGVALGKAQSSQSSCAAAAEGAYLTRRFSSGPSGTHARLCMA